MSRVGLSGAIRVSKEVADALNHSHAVVALESTIISHGMPWPTNYEMASEVEALVRERGAIPATIALMDGNLHIGLSSEQLERLARGGTSVRKCSRRDLAHLMSTGGLGATTVSGTMIGASLAGIKVFATGGIGGVHRGGELSMDVSADLRELGRTPVAVVCSGVKSILDIGRTLEVLETEGVMVSVVGEKDAGFPAFFTPDSGLPAPMRVANAEEAAQVTFNSLYSLGLDSGLLFAVPNPSPADAELIEEATQQALREAEEKGVEGAAITPFLLDRIDSITNSQSLESNVALVKHNASFAADLAVHLASKTNAVQTTPTSSPAVPTMGGGGTRGLCSMAAPRETGVTSAAKTSSVVVVGGALWDVYARPVPGEELAMGASSPGQVGVTAGGVGRNIATAASGTLGGGISGGGGDRGGRVVMCTALGKDESGVALRNSLEKDGVEVCGQEREGDRTPQYVAMMHDDGNLVAAIADTEALDSATFSTLFPSSHPSLASPSVVVAEANLSESILTDLCSHLLSQPTPTPLFLDPVGPSKSARIMSPSILGVTALLAPDSYELHAMASTWRRLAQEGEFPAPSPISPSSTAIEHDDDHDDDYDNQDFDGAPPPPSHEPHTPSSSLDAGGLAELASGVLAAKPDLLQRHDIQERMKALGITEDDITSFLTHSHDSSPSTTTSPSMEETQEGEDDGEMIGGVSEEVVADAHCLLAALCNPGANETGVGLIEGRKHVLAKLGSEGIFWVSRQPCASTEEWWKLSSNPFYHDALDLENPRSAEFTRLRAPSPPRLVSVSGAGDTLLGTLSALVATKTPFSQSLLIAMAASYLTIQSTATTPDASDLAALARAARGGDCDTDASNIALRAVLELNMHIDGAEDLLERV